MRVALQPRARALLRAHPDGLTCDEICTLLNYHSVNLSKFLRKMPDVYIDRWIKGGRGQYKAVWCVVIPPADCPHPRHGDTTK